MRIALSHVLFCILAIGFLASCSDIGIVKRRYRPGFHVDVRSNSEKVIGTEKINDEQPQRSPTQATSEVFCASTDQISERLSNQRVDGHFKKVPFQEIKLAERPDASHLNIPTIKQTTLQLRNDLLATAEENRAWSVLSLVAFGLVITAFTLLVIGIGFLSHVLSKNYSSSDANPVPYLLLTAFALAMAGFFIGIGGKKRAKRNQQKGRGYGMAAFIAGIVMMALSLLSLLIAGVAGGL